MEIIAISFVLFIMSYLILFVVSMAMLDAELIKPRTALTLLIGGFFTMGIMSGIIGLLFKALLIMGD